MVCLGIIKNTKDDTILAAHCDNPNCYNFTTNHDLAGSVCSDACWLVIV